ncbi:type VI secretion system baseplate subunit TssE [Desulfatitalea tepidiphila]|uniref:type VI secretion system baseplate subunit TssE n=1 Tax=Desulfatitalea tepidiphila TaxID=1185843 RepID=UPI0006B5B35C|nr:type VI secretion system baseplate subunit TssE [Desulfatitalea tepidiphila]
MREKRLLERLRAIDRNPDWRGESDPRAAISSVLDHLGKILNTRQGSALIATDLGMPDFTSVSSSLSADALPEMADTITRVINTYEPRLTDVTVDFEPLSQQSFKIGFKLSAKVRGETRDIPVVFETVLTSDGHITVLE